MEIVHDLHQQAVANGERWCNECCMTTGDILDEDAFGVNLDFRCCDFTVDTEWVDVADLIFIHGIVFEKCLMEHLEQQLCPQVKAGTYIVTVSRPLVNEEAFERIAELQVQMSWGRGTAYLQRRR